MLIFRHTQYHIIVSIAGELHRISDDSICVAYATRSYYVWNPATNGPHNMHLGETCKVSRLRAAEAASLVH